MLNADSVLIASCEMSVFYFSYPGCHVTLNGIAKMTIPFSTTVYCVCSFSLELIYRYLEAYHNLLEHT